MLILLKIHEIPLIFIKKLNNACNFYILFNIYEKFFMDFAKNCLNSYKTIEDILKTNENQMK